jgi:hypothetical protein
MCLSAAIRQVSCESFQDVPFPEKSTKDVRKRLAAVLRLGAKSFAEHMSIKTAATLVLSNKSRDRPRVRAASISEELVRALNGIFDASVVDKHGNSIESSDRDRPDDSQVQETVVMQRVIQVIDDHVLIHPV